MANNVTWKQLAVVIALVMLITSCIFGANEIIDYKDDRVRGEILELVDMKLELLLANVELIIKRDGLKPIKKADLIKYNERRKENGKENPVTD